MGESLMRLKMMASIGAVALSAYLPAAADAALVYNFNLNGSLANEGTGTGMLVNNGATLGATGLTFTANQGPTLTGATPLSAYTIDLVFSFDATSGYRKIVDFLNLASDTGLYNLNGALNFYPTVTGSDSTTAGSPVRVTFSRDALGNAIGYLNGVQQFTLIDTSGQAVFGSVINFLQDDNATGRREASSGFVDYIRVFDQVLTPIQAVPPTTAGAVPEPATWAMLLLGFGGVGQALRRRPRVGARIRFA